jgi:WD40 repeat protein
MRLTMTIPPLGLLLSATRPRLLVAAISTLAISAPPLASAQERIRVHEFSGGLQSLGFSATGGGYAASVVTNDTVLHDTKTGRIVKQFDRALGHTYAVAYGPADRLFASAVADQDRGGETFFAVRGWVVATGAKQFDLAGHDAKIVSVAFSPGANTIASGQLDGKVRLWRPDRKQPLATLNEHVGEVLIAFTPGGREFVTAGGDGQLLVWDTESFKLSARLNKKGGQAIRALSFSAKGDELLVADGGGAIQIWDLPKRKQTGTVKLDIPDKSVVIGRDLMAVAAGPRLAAMAVGKSVLVWDLATGKLIGRFEHPRLYEVRGLSISPDGKTLLTGATHMVTDKTEVVLWSLAPPRK